MPYQKKVVFLSKTCHMDHNVLPTNPHIVTNSKPPYPLIEADVVPQNPCIPSPCGPYSNCREINQHAVCSCLPNHIGTPPACRPECSVSSECPQDKACVNLRCVDPCPGTCGLNAQCKVTNHNPICTCSADFTGDPFIRCSPVQSKLYRLKNCLGHFVLQN